MIFGPWISHDGRSFPVADGEVVWIRAPGFFGGNIETTCHARRDDVSLWQWALRGEGPGITAYRRRVSVEFGRLRQAVERPEVAPA